jgi:hypothetical protein
LQFSPASALVNEATDTVTMKVSIENPSATEPTTAQIILRDGDANDVDSFVTRTVVFPAGDSSPQEVTINVTNNKMAAEDRTLVFAIREITGGKDTEVGYYPTFNLTLGGYDTPEAPQTPFDNSNPVVQETYPNPFSNQVNIPFSISKASDVRVDIYNLKGQHIRTLTSGSKDAGSYNLSWDGKDNNGSRVSPGVYMYRLTSGDFTTSKKMILVK